MVARSTNWPMALSDYLQARRAVPFEWGVQDCLVFVSKAVQTLTGDDFMAQFPAYSTESEASALLEQYGDVYGIVSACLGEPTTNILTGHRGDVVMLELPQQTAGIIDDSGERIAVCSKDGLLRLPLDKAIYLWRY